jgi:hypothetical protein
MPGPRNDSGDLILRTIYWPAFMFAAAALVLSGQPAAARCAGGGALKGSFGTNLNGPTLGGSTAEVFSGILTSDGKCNLSGSLTGGTYGQGSATSSVTGTYSVPADKQGSVSLLLPGSSSGVSFGIGLIRDGKAAEVTGIALSGTATLTLDMTAIAGKRYNLSDLSGTYVATCTGASNSGSGGLGTELAYSTFDGDGNLTAANAVGNNDGTPFSVSLSGTYAVNADGSFTTQYPAPYSQYVVYGEIVSNGTETRSVLVDTTAGAGAYRSCISKKQS